MRSRPYPALVAVAAVAALTATACTAQSQEQQKPKGKAALFKPGSEISYQKYGKDYPATKVKDVPGPCSYEAISRKDYSGQTLKIISHAVPVIGEPTQLHAKQFEDITGGKVEVVNVPFGELHQKILTPLQAGQPAYDVMFYPSLWIGDMAPYLAPVPKKYLNTPGMKDVTKAYMDVATWDEKVVQYPVDGDRHYLKVRTDVLKDPKRQAEYKKATGKDLKVPTTWAEYQQIAEFFSGKDFDGDGKRNYGSAEVTKRDDLTFSAFISRAAPYVKNADVEGGVFFDVETMQPLINTPGFVRALEDMVKAKSTWAPGGANFGLGDEIFSFGGGQTLMSYSWDDAFIQAQQPDSRIRNEVEAAPLPGSGGQQQRVAMARALARATGILLLDEPLANLDYKLREQLRDEFKTLFSDRGDTIVIYTTTEPAEAMMLGDVVLVMHEGRILQTGTPQEVFERPATTTVASIIDDPPMNIFAGRIEGGQVTVAGFQATHASAHLADLPDGAYQFGLRATDVGLAAGGVEGEVTFVEISGSETFVHVVVGESPFVVQIEGIHDVALGDLVKLRLRPDRLFAFDEQGTLVRTPSYDLASVEGR
ncbi:extracellular solute-binding protein [Streptomyces sp. HC307]|uniref:extracellular solute-binding protein n=1 Tax=Streptomyces flavusporus TaxID=3385496 RepID=UPI0039173C3C